MEKILKYLLACMLFFSFYTHTININSGNIIISRMTFSDVFGVLAIVLYLMDKILTKKLFVEIPKLFVLAYVVVICFFVTIVTSLNPIATIFEILILGYLISLAFVMYEVFKKDVSFFFTVLLTTSFVMSFIGLYDLFAANNGWVTFFDSDCERHATSGFRYFAQTGNYSFTMLSILIPFRYFNSNLNFRFTRFFNTTIIITILLMIASGAISIIISFCIGVVLLGVTNLSNKKILIDISSLVGVVICFIITTYFFANALFENISYRIESRITDRQPGASESSFIIENFKDSIQAFCDNYLFGTGLGGFVNNYSEFEIHGTYLKVIGETGLIGIIGYLIFLYFFVKFILGMDKQYIKYFLPFFIASLVSWSYNYHFRKKEFWILFAFLMIIDHIFRKNKNGKK